MRGKRSRSQPLRAGIAALAFATGLGGMVLTAAPAAAHGTHVLVFSQTAGFRHDSIPDGVAAITALGAEHEVTAAEDAGAFTDENLAEYAAVVWLSTTGDVLNTEQQGAFERYIEGGGGYAGVHAAADTEYSWPWYGELVGSYFQSHPHIQEADVLVEDTDHPSTAHLPGTWTRTDEWYSYQSNPRGRVKVLAALDEASYTPTDPSGDHPIAWCHSKGAGRSWYTGMGHTKESFAEPAFLAHLKGGIEYAAGLAEADCAPDPDAPPTDADFDQITLARGEEKTGEPIALAVLPDREVVHTSRDGRVWLTTPEATTTLAGRIPVYNHDEDGLQGVAVDPDFATNRWLYLYYAPPLDTPAGGAPTDGSAEDFARFTGHNQLSRFRLTEDGTLDTASEQRILQVPADRGLCGHAGGRRSSSPPTTASRSWRQAGRRATSASATTGSTTTAPPTSPAASRSTASPATTPLNCSSTPLTRWSRPKRRRIARKKLGLRYAMNVIPLDPSPVRGTHGRLPESADDGPVLLSNAELGVDRLAATDVRDLLLSLQGLKGNPR